MADVVKVDGVHPYDGRYELDLEETPFTTREWGWVKRYAGYLPVSLNEDTFADPEMIAIVAIIAIHRNGKIETGEVGQLWERFQDAPFGSTITFEFGEQEEGADSGLPRSSSNGNESISGGSSKSISGSPGGRLSPTGSPDSAISGSAPATSAT